MAYPQPSQGYQPNPPPPYGGQPGYAPQPPPQQYGYQPGPQQQYGYQPGQQQQSSTSNVVVVQQQAQPSVSG